MSSALFYDKGKIDQLLSAKQDVFELSDYYKKNETSSSVELTQKFNTLSTYSQTKNQLSNDGYLTSHQSLSDYYKKSETSSSNEIRTEFDTVENKIDTKIYFDAISSSGYNDLSIIKISNEDYRKLVSEGKCLSNALYIVSSDFEDFYGKVLSNVTMTDDSVESEAATKHYVDQQIISSNANLSAYGKTLQYVSSDKKIYLKNGTNVLGQVDCTDFIKDGMLSSVELCGNILVFKFNTDTGTTPISVNLSSFIDLYTAGNGLCCENKIFRIDTNVVAVKNDLTSYYTKNETSSSSEISVAFDNKVKTGDYSLSAYHLKSQDLSVVRINENDYYDLVDKDTVLSDIVYIISSDNLNARDQRIIDVADPISANDAATKGYVDSRSRYKMVTKELTLSSVTIEGTPTTGYVAYADDQTINTVTLSTNIYPLFIYLPSQLTDNSSRDFLVRVEVLTSTAPTVGFFGSSESCDFESEDSSWATLEPGVNLFNFTETRR